MSYCEVRFFKKDGSCVNVKEFDVLEDAIEYFNRHVETAKVFLELDYSDIKGFDPEKALCHGIQVVERDHAMTWLVEQANWTAAQCAA